MARDQSILASYTHLPNFGMDWSGLVFSTLGLQSIQFRNEPSNPLKTLLRLVSRTQASTPEFNPKSGHEKLKLGSTMQDCTPLASFDPLVREWFANHFSAVTEPQQMGWPEIRAGHDVLVSAPTGSGKTLAAFLTAIDSLIVQARESELPNQTQILYVSPLKALSNDVHRNLDIPLAGIRGVAEQHGIT